MERRKRSTRDDGRRLGAIPSSTGLDVGDARFRRLFAALGRVGAAPGDTDEERLQKTLLVASTTMMASLAVVWGGLYAAFDELLAASIPLSYSATSLVSLALFARLRRYGLFRASQLALSLLLPFFLMLSLGGFVGSSAVVLWSLTSPLGALVFAGRRPAAGWFAAYLLLIVLGATLGGGSENQLPGSLVTAFFVLNLAGVSVVAFVLLQYFVGERDLAVTIIDRERRWIRDAFSSYISPNLVRHLIEHPDQLALGGERRECTFVMSDLAGFTALVEQAEPEVVVELLNEYLAGLTQIALDEDGTLDRIVGDAVAVMFSAPVAQDDHADRAVRCALAMDRFGRDFAARAARRHLPVRGTRIGVCSGPVIVGHVGGRERLDYRALGDPINTAKRLEDANRYTGTRVCVSKATVLRSTCFVGRPIGLLRLAGKRELVEGWEPLQHDAPELDWLQDYGDVYELMSTGEQRALAAVRALEQERPSDPLVRFHRRRLEVGGVGALVDLSRKGEAYAEHAGPTSGPRLKGANPHHHVHVEPTGGGTMDASTRSTRPLRGAAAALLACVVTASFAPLAAAAPLPAQLGLRGLTIGGTVILSHEGSPAYSTGCEVVQLD